VARHASREPRAHWVLLLLGVLVVLGELCFGGYVHHVGAEGGGPRPVLGDEPPGPEAVVRGGPVVRVDTAGNVTTRSAPADTVALTFDDGPDPKWTPLILDVLARYDAHATFFVIGSRVNEYPDLTRRILSEGHEIGLHTFTHTELVTVPSWRRRLELTLTQNAIAGATGRSATLMRPPFASVPDAVRRDEFDAFADVARGAYLTVLADRDTEDWRRPGVDAIVAAATPKRGDGAVVMLHDGGGDRSQTVAAVEQLLEESPAYRFTTVSEALGLVTGNPPASRASRSRGYALRAVQTVSAWLSEAMVVLLAVALVLAAGRLLLQVATARVHVRRVRRRDGPLRYLGPVSVIVPAYNEAATIAATVRTLHHSDYPWVEVIVVDDGSTDATADIVGRLRLPRVRVVRQANSGKPGALNTGLRYARGGLVVLVDGDTVVEPDAIGRLVQAFADPDVGAVSGNTRVGNRRGLLGRWQHLEYVMGFNLDRRMFEIGECMPTVPGAIGAFRREALRDVGGVPVATLAEDTDLTMSVIRAGWRVVYCQSAVAWTEAPATLRQLWRQRYRWCYGTMQAMWKHRRSLVERGPAGKLGRRGLVYLGLFQVLLPLTAPAVDAYAGYGLLFLPLTQVAAVWFGFLGLNMLTAAYALRLDGERYGPLWALPVQQVVYRQLMYLVVFQSTVTALMGIRLRWHRMTRTGSAAQVGPAVRSDVSPPRR
jgi:cellulose synthase/poly-beta-1,6-N-acetylglucosamine synthase-like glycosyltransferase/peptidoglycan/xylan/chitin deacetylase (PgdA/CDA1 family)